MDRECSVLIEGNISADLKHSDAVPGVDINNDGWNSGVIRNHNLATVRKAKRRSETRVLAGETDNNLKRETEKRLYLLPSSNGAEAVYANNDCIGGSTPVRLYRGERREER